MKSLLLCLLVLLVAAGCSQSLLREGHRAADEGNYGRAIDLYYEEIAAHPQNADAWRALGLAFYQRDDLDKAEDALKQAIAIAPDPQAQMYIGLILEKRGNTDQAIDAYGTALSLKPGGQTRNILRAHVDRLLHDRIKKEVDDALAGEEAISPSEIPVNTIAVTDFGAAGVRSDLAPIARGLAEFTAIDLAKVKSLRVVDRLKIDVILDELKLGQTGAVDPTSAPRLGRLLGSRHVVTATVLGVGDEAIRLDGVVINTLDSSSLEPETREGQLRELFGVQKEFVFRVIDNLGIELTVEERDAIAEVPTESFLAFMSYSRGLDYQRRGMLQEASGSFNEAAAHDPGFGQAAARAASIDGAMALGGAQHAFGAFEQVVAATEVVSAITTGLESTISRVTSNIGNLPDLSGRQPAQQPPSPGGTVPVTVRGNLNGN